MALQLYLKSQPSTEKLQAAQPSNSLPQMVCGDLNVTLLAQDRPDNSNHRAHTARFRTLVDRLQLQDLRLDRFMEMVYTWSNDHDTPSFARLDRFMVSTTWSQIFPNSVQTTISNTTSDHCPLICQVQTKFLSSNIFLLENSWIKNSEFKDLVNQQWAAAPTATSSSKLHNKIIGMRKVIIQQRKTYMEVHKYHKKICKDCLHWLAQQSEAGRLTNVEKLLKQLLLQRYSDICQMEEEKWHQRAKRTWVNKGDKNTKYFHLLATKRKKCQFNRCHLRRRHTTLTA